MEWGLNQILTVIVGVCSVLTIVWKIILRPNLDKSYMKRNECEFKEREQNHISKELSQAIGRLDKTISRLETHVELIISGKIRSHE